MPTTLRAAKPAAPSTDLSTADLLVMAEYSVTSPDEVRAIRAIQSDVGLIQLQAGRLNPRKADPSEYRARQKVLEVALNAEARLGAIIGPDRAAERLGFTLGSVLRRLAEVDERGRTTLAPHEARSALETPGLVVDAVGPTVIRQIATTRALLDVVPTERRFEQGIGGLNVPILSTLPGLPGAVAEGDPDTLENAGAFTTKAVDWQKWTARVRWTDEVEEDSAVSLFAAMETALLGVVGDRAEATICTSTDGLGTLTAIGATAAASAGAGTIRDIVRAASVVASNGFRATHAVMNPAAWTKITDIIDSSTGVPVCASAERFTEMTGLVPVLANGQPAATVTVGDFRDEVRACTLYYRTSPQIVVSRMAGPAFQNDLTEAKYHMRGAFAVHAPAAFRRVTNF